MSPLKHENYPTFPLGDPLWILGAKTSHLGQTFQKLCWYIHVQNWEPNHYWAQCKLLQISKPRSLIWIDTSGVHRRISPQKSVLCATVIFKNTKNENSFHVLYLFFMKHLIYTFIFVRHRNFWIFDWWQNRQYQRHRYWGNILYLFKNEHRPIKCYYISSMVRMYRFSHTRCTNLCTVFSHFDVSQAA